MRVFLGLLVLGLLVFGSYSPVIVLESELVFDDNLAIQDNADASSDKGLFHPSFLLHDFWGNQAFDNITVSHKSYRPVTVFTFRFEHFINGDFDSQRMHVTNIVLHFVVCIVLWIVLREGSQQFGFAESHYFITVVVVLFAVHPIHTESVSSIVGRAEVLAALLGLSAFYFFCTGFYALFVVLMIACCLSKDSGIVFAGLCLVHELVRHILRRTTRFRILYIVTAVLMIVGYFGFRKIAFSQVDLKGSGFLRKAENPQALMSGFPLSMFLWFIQVKYLSLLIWPWPLCCEYSYKCISPFEEGKYVTDVRFFPMLIASLVVVVFVGDVAFRTFQGVRSRQPDVDSTLVLYFVAWTVVPYLPVSHLIVTVGTLLGERCLYVPSIGICALIGLGIVSMKRYRGLIALVILVSIFCAMTAVRSENWINSERLFEEAVKVCPDSAKNRQQLAMVRLNQMKTAEARKQLEKADEIDPTFCEPRYHLARIALNQSKTQEGIEFLRSCMTGECSQTIVVKCFTLYKAARDIFNLSQAEQSNDTAHFIPDLAAKAHQYRQAGLGWVNEGKYCTAKNALSESVALRLKNNWFQVLANGTDNLASVDDNLCNTMYWLLKSSFKCLQLSTLSDTSRFGERVESTISNLQHFFSQCNTMETYKQWDWNRLKKLDNANAQELCQRVRVFATVAIEFFQMVAESPEAVHGLSVYIQDELSKSWNEFLFEIAMAVYENIRNAEEWRETIQSQATVANEDVSRVFDVEKFISLSDTADQLLRVAVSQAVQLLTSLSSQLYTRGVDILILSDKMRKIIQQIDKADFAKCEVAYFTVVSSLHLRESTLHRLMKKLEFCSSSTQCPKTADYCTQLQAKLMSEKKIE